MKRRNQTNKNRAAASSPVSQPPSDQPAKSHLAGGIVKFQHLPWWLGFLLVAGIIIAYQPAWHAGFIWDDDDYVTNNPLLTAPDGLRRIWFSLDSPSQYFPLTYTAFLIERAIWGLNPAGYHWVNILLHAVNALLVWRLLTRLSIPGAWLAAAIFALHPVQVESVAWITEQKNLLSLFFILLTLLAYTRFVQARSDAGCELLDAGQQPAASSVRHPVSSILHYWLALIFYALALFSKTTACTVPAALLLILWLKAKPVNRWRLAPIVPFVALSAGMGLLTMWWERFHIGTQGKLFALGMPERLLVASHALWFYLGKLVWPVNLTFSYPRWTINPADPFACGWLAAGAGLCAAIYFARRYAGRSIEVAALFFVVMLSPLLGFIMLYTFRYSFVADHYQYVASIGPIALAAAGITGVFGWLKKSSPFLKPAFCGALLLTLGVLTWRQCGMYVDSETLWRTTLERNPGSFLADNNLGYLLLQEGQTNQVIALGQRSLQIEPDNPQAYNNLGNALLKMDQVDKAIGFFQAALQADPTVAEYYYNLATALLRAGKTDAAIANFQRALEIKPARDPRAAEFHYNLAAALLRAGKTDAAITHFQAALEINPDYDEARNNLAITLLKIGRANAAIVQFQKALETDPNNLEARINLATVLLRGGQVDQAISHYEAALKIQPGAVVAHNNLGLAFLEKGEVEQTVFHWEKVLELQPDDAGVNNNLAWLLATCPKASVRNGARAVALAGHANQLSDGENPSYLGTLAAAYAETGKFAEAIATGQRAVQLATAKGNDALAGRLQGCLQSYRADRPVRDTSQAIAP